MCDSYKPSDERRRQFGNGSGQEDVWNEFHVRGIQEEIIPSNGLLALAYSFLPILPA